jgi:hypothetical protein
MFTNRLLGHRLAFVFVLFFPGLVFAQQPEPRVSIELELGQVWQERNKVQIPNSAAGDRFLLTDIVGNGPWTSARVNMNWNLQGPHNLRLVLAPLAYEEQGRVADDVRFAGGNFLGGEPLQAEYKFNSWRLGYSYQFYEANRWRLWLGATAKVRDAKIELRQNGTRAIDDNVGFVPLVYFAGDYQLSPRWSAQFDFDGLAGGPGRAFDLSLKLGYRLSEQWQLSAGYRTLEGGVDSEDVYNFAWFNTALVSLSYQF